MSTLTQIAESQAIEQMALMRRCGYESPIYAVKTQWRVMGRTMRVRKRFDAIHYTRLSQILDEAFSKKGVK